jgi:hypothetical protein
MTMALPPVLEAVAQEMERRGAKASGQIDDVVKSLESGDLTGVPLGLDFDIDDPSVVQRLDELSEAAADAAIACAVGTPPTGYVPTRVRPSMYQIVRGRSRSRR